MNSYFILYFLVSNGLIIILDKYTFRDRLALLGMKLGSYKGFNMIGKLLNNISKCEFCFDHHVSLITVSIIGCIFGYEIEQLFYPIMIAVIMSILNSLKSKQGLY